MQPLLCYVDFLWDLLFRRTCWASFLPSSVKSSGIPKTRREHFSYAFILPLRLRVSHNPLRLSQIEETSLSFWKFIEIEERKLARTEKSHSLSICRRILLQTSPENQQNRVPFLMNFHSNLALELTVKVLSATARYKMSLVYCENLLRVVFFF